MFRLFIQSILTVLGNAIGLIVAAMIVPGVSVSLFGLTISILFFTITQAILAPFVLKMAIKYVPAFRGGIALVTTFVVLVLTAWLTDGLRIDGLVAWFVAPLVVWLAAVISGIVLPGLLLKEKVSQKKQSIRDI